MGREKRSKFANDAKSTADLASSLAQLVTYNIKNFIQAPETVYDNAVTRIVDDITAKGLKRAKITFPRGEYKFNALTTRCDNLTIEGQDAKLIPTNNTNFMWTHYGDNFKVKGFYVEPDISDTFRVFKVLNDGTTSSDYATFEDVEMYNCYQGIHIYMDGAISTGAYRHKIRNCKVRNFLNRPWTGSFGVFFDGNTAGNASGNDSVLIDCYVKGYESNIKVKNSIGFKIVAGSVDGGVNGLYLDGASYTSLVASYFEYNTNSITAVNNPYDLYVIATTLTNHTTGLNGTFNSGGLPTFVGGSAVIGLAPAVKGLIGAETDGFVNVDGFKGVKLNISGEGRFLKFGKISTNRYGFDMSGLQASDNLEFNIPTGKKIHFGGVGSVYGSLDEDGSIAVKRTYSVFGLITFGTGDVSPAVDKSNVFQTNNTATTTIIRFDEGKVGHEFTLKGGDVNTTIAHNANIVFKSGVAKTLALNETVTFICYSVTTNTNCVYYEK
jgi:hypothetical protein